MNGDCFITGATFILDDLVVIIAIIAIMRRRKRRKIVMTGNLRQRCWHWQRRWWVVLVGSGVKGLHQLWKWIQSEKIFWWGAVHRVQPLLIFNSYKIQSGGRGRNTGPAQSFKHLLTLPGDYFEMLMWALPGWHAVKAMRKQYPTTTKHPIGEISSEWYHDQWGVLN